jgi:DNA-binding SARP family transcriptional activator
MDVDVRVLGPLEVHCGGTRVDLGTPKQRTVMALLLMNINEPVTPARLVAELWPESPPPSAAANVVTYLSRLRSALGTGGCTLARQDARYVLTLPPESVDLHRFATEAADGDAANAAGDVQGAAEHWRRAVGLWRGELFEGVPTGPRLDIARAEWGERRLAVFERYAQSQLRLGNAAGVVSELRRHARAEPLRETGWLLLMAALYLSGNPAAALEAYEQARTLLAEQLGVDPTERVRELHRAVLAEDVVRVWAILDEGTGAPASGPATPAQLPADVPGFTGRDAELSTLDSLLTGSGSTAVVISAVSGTAGVGKTALALRWAHRSRRRFPGGQLYVNLRGYDPGQPMTAAEALARFLAALGVAGADIPADVDERAARYRTEVANRQLLIVLDNASTVEQVRPLLPGDGSCTVLVTSRDSLAGLVAIHGARRIDLDPLPEADAIAVLRRLIGARVDAEPEAAAALAVQCVRLPLALRVAAELAVSRPASTLAALVAELADQQRRLDLLDAGGDPRAAVAAVFSWSVRHLPAGAARAFRLLGLHPGPDFDVYAVAALGDTGLPEAYRILDLLARAHLVVPAATGRYGMHDLLRAYAARLAASEDDRAAAQQRLFDFYLATAAAAMDARYPAEAHRRPRVPPASTAMPALTDPDAALAWLEAELPNLASIAANGPADHVVRLSATLFRYLDGGHSVDALAIHGHARDAARRGGDRAGEAQALLDLGATHMQLSQYRHAADLLRQALALFRDVGDEVGQARTLSNLAIVESRLGRFREAADLHAQVLALFRQIGDRTGEARALGSLSDAEERLGNYEAAAGHLAQALDLFRKTGDRVGEAFALTNLGVVEERLDRYDAATAHHEEALAQFRQLGHRRGEAWTLDSLGDVHTHLGRSESGAGYHRRALELFREIGDLDGEAWALNGLGEAASAAGNPAEAQAHHEAALAIAVDTGAADQEARAHTGLGHARRTVDDPAAARQYYEKALALYLDLGMPEAERVRSHLATLGV